MQLTLTPSDQVQDVDGIPCRIWKGATEEGVPVFAWISCVQPQTHDPEKLRAFDDALQALPTPERYFDTVDLRFARRMPRT